MRSNFSTVKMLSKFRTIPFKCAELKWNLFLKIFHLDTNKIHIYGGEKASAVSLKKKDAELLIIIIFIDSICWGMRCASCVQAKKKKTFLYCCYFFSRYFPSATFNVVTFYGSLMSAIVCVHAIGRCGDL